MKAIILAAGRGSRMQKLTEKKPKCLIELHGKPLLQWQSQALIGAGIKEIGVVRGYQREQLSSIDYTYFDNERWNETNMVASLMCASEWLEEEECLVSYADIIYPSETVKKLCAAKGDIIVSYNTKWRELWEERFVDPLSDAETFQIDSNGLLTEIGGRAKTLDEIQGQYMGLLKFTPKGWHLIKQYLQSVDAQRVASMDMTSLLKRLISNKVSVHTIEIDGNWYEVDNANDLEIYSKRKSLF